MTDEQMRRIKRLRAYTHACTAKVKRLRAIVKAEEAKPLCERDPILVYRSERAIREKLQLRHKHETEISTIRRRALKQRRRYDAIQPNA